MLNSAKPIVGYIIRGKYFLFFKSKTQKKQFM